MTDQATHRERFRPQFHFSARKNWLNDPNGCVFYAGEYHLFYQHNPQGNAWGNMTWGHAVSPDLVHWQELPYAILPYDGGDIFSGSAVVDWNNTTGLGEGSLPPLVALFTHARPPCTQALAFSNDRGRSWKLYNSGQPVVPNQGRDDYERDPKVFWHQPTQKWVMVLWLQMDSVGFFVSDDLINWRHASDFVGEGFWECPDLLELPVDGDIQNRKWVLHDANFKYWIGVYDGVTFQPEAGPFQGDSGGNFYAAQTWNNTRERVLHIAWMRGGEYPGMPFNQQMSFPCELALRKTPLGIRLCRLPVKEIENLYVETIEFKDVWLESGRELLTDFQGDLLDINIDLEIDQEASFSIHVHDQVVAWSNGLVSCLGKTAPLRLIGSAIKIRLLVDRTSIELFGNDGELSMSGCFLPSLLPVPVGCRTDISSVRIRSLVIHKLSSIW